jgi:hypothetical protein
LLVEFLKVTGNVRVGGGRKENEICDGQFQREMKKLKGQSEDGVDDDIVGGLPSRANNIINNNIRFSYLLVDNMLVTSLITFNFF